MITRNCYMQMQIKVYQYQDKAASRWLSVTSLLKNTILSLTKSKEPFLHSLSMVKQRRKMHILSFLWSAAQNEIVAWVWTYTVQNMSNPIEIRMRVIVS